MPKVVLLQPEPHAPFHREMMGRVMQHIITDIAENKPGENGRSEVPKNQKENAVKQKGERDANTRRHHKPLRIIRIIVMDPVNYVMQSFSDASLGLIMENVPVDEVLQQRPQQHA